MPRLKTKGGGLGGTALTSQKLPETLDQHDTLHGPLSTEPYISAKRSRITLDLRLPAAEFLSEKVPDGYL